MLLVIYYLQLQKSITRRDLLKLKLQNNSFRWTLEEEWVGDKTEFGRRLPDNVVFGNSCEFSSDTQTLVTEHTVT